MAASKLKVHTQIHPQKIHIIHEHIHFFRPNQPISSINIELSACGQCAVAGISRRGWVYIVRKVCVCVCVCSWRRLAHGSQNLKEWETIISLTSTFRLRHHKANTLRAADERLCASRRPRFYRYWFFMFVLSSEATPKSPRKNIYMYVRYGPPVDRTDSAGPYLGQHRSVYAGVYHIIRRGKIYRTSECVRVNHMHTYTHTLNGHT